MAESGLMTGIPFVAYPGYDHMDENNIELIPGLPVSGILSGKGEIQRGTIPEGKIIICMYRYICRDGTGLQWDAPMDG